jgi:DNA polymerase-1
MPGMDGELLYPSTGYDPRFGTWLDPQAPPIRTMGLDEALELILEELFPLPENGGFWWHDEQARTHAIARFLTPMCRGLMKWRRTPLWIFDGNREGCGKDTCANVAHLVYTGAPVICAPLSKDCDEEMRKRITSALMQGSRYFHLANMKGHVRYASLEAATDDSGIWEDRRLGASETLRLPNETEYSFSANNATWEPDIERRCRRIRLRFCPEHVNAHRYRHADIRQWLLGMRQDLVSAAAALVTHWVRMGSPAGPSPFASFPVWGRVVGGVMHACGLGDPCLPHEESQSSGDQNTQAMRALFELSLREHGDAQVSRQDYNAWVQRCTEVQEIFDWLDLATRRGMTTLGKLLARFDGRELTGITLRSRQTSKNRGTYQFILSGGPAPSITSPTSPTSPETPDLRLQTPSERGHGDIRGHSSYARIGENKSEEKNKKSGELNVLYRGVGTMSPDVLMSPRPVIHTSRRGVERAADDLRGAGRIALDIETFGPRKGDGLNPWRGEIRLLTLRKEEGTVHVIDLVATGYDLGPLREVLESSWIIAHNAKFDLLWLRVKCGLNVRQVWCTLTAARLLTAGTRPGNSLDKCLERYLDVPPGPDHSLSDWGSMLLTEEQIAYAVADVSHLHALLAVLERELTEAGLEGVHDMESSLLPVIIDMEERGVHVSRERLTAIATEARAQESAALVSLRDALGVPALNAGSPKQLLAALASAGIVLESTAEEALKAADDGRIIPLILAHREASKRAQQAESLIGHIERDGRIHSGFDQTGTATGRFSSRDPNLQNVGRGELRAAFTAPEGRRLVVADYSQIELRAAAAIAGETKMIEAYRNGADLHRLTAATVLGKDLADVTKADRQTAKVVSFGLLYGQSASGLVRYAASAYGVTMEEEEAQRIRSAFFRTYSRLRQWHGTSHNAAADGVTEVRTRSGRRRLIPETASEWERFTALVNTPVQGGTADGMKLAIIRAGGSLPEGAFLVSTVHDELVAECREEDAEAVKAIIMDCMIRGMGTLFGDVPVEVEASVCSTWGDK